jgi:hypothetical protein
MSLVIVCLYEGMTLTVRHTKKLRIFDRYVSYLVRHAAISRSNIMKATTFAISKQL